MIRFVAAAVVIAIAGCGGKATGSGSPGDGSGEPVPASLVIPPTPGTARDLARLRQRAAGGSVAAGWMRAHYLLDLFDHARFGRDDASLRLLATELGIRAERGAAATRRVSERLMVEVDGVLEADRLHAGAQRARTLIEFDVNPPRERKAVLQRMIELKTIARGGGPMASNAVLRLAGYCLTAGEDARRARPGERPRVLAHCLYPLYDSDPDPYFAPAAATRPPAPDARELGRRLDHLLDRKTWGRLAATGAATRQRARDWFAAHATSLLPALPDPASAGLAAVDTAAPYDFTPVLDLGDGNRLEAAATYSRRVGPDVLTDGRGTVAVSLAAHAPASALVRAAEAAIAARAHTLELLVVIRQRLQVPPGDYWSGRLDGDMVLRHGVVALSLATMPGGAAARAAESRRPSGWDPAQAALRLHLVVGTDRWSLVAPGGDIATINAGDRKTGAAAELRRALARVREAFPDENGLVLVPGPRVTLGAIVEAMVAASVDDAGAPLFRQIALAPAVPARSPRRDLDRRIARRAPARAEIQPTAVQARAPAARRCYQALLEKSPRLSGQVQLELAGGKARAVAGPERLRACAVEAVGEAMAAGQVATAQVTFSLAP